MIVISDTSPLNYLVLIGESDVLPALFGRVLVPNGVMLELQHERTPEVVRAFASCPPPWLEVRAAKSRMDQPRLGPGESEAIALASELKADALLVDDRDARRAAKQAGLFVTGTLGVLEAAAAAGLTQLRPSLDRLARTSFRMSPQQVEAALRRDRARRLGS
jgi:predicted nucleic acid-binding protein